MSELLFVQNQFLSKKLRGHGIDKLLQDAERYSLNDDDLRRITQNKSNILTYTDLEYMNNINDVFDGYEAAIILYEVKPTVGHWVSLIKRSQNHITFFDPYGFDIDQELNFSRKDYIREESGKGHLYHLLDESNYTFDSSPYKLQSEIKDVNTCGRYAGLRVRLRHLNNHEFSSLFMDNKYYKADLWVTALTLFV